jgi:acetyl esterase/lipase
MKKLSSCVKKSFSLATLALGLGLLAQSASADVIKPGAPHFTQIGQKSSFQWVPENYVSAAHPSNFSYDIFYYIPKTLEKSSKVNALIFNHGGGDSTLDRDGSIKAVGLYIKDLMKLADELNCVVVLPSANGLNWGGHTVGLMTALSKLMREELDIDPQHLGLSGHSMGGMGITRAYWQLADQFAFFLPQADGMDLSYATDDVTEWQLNKVFNVAYTQLQGTHDAFDIFVTRNQDQLRRTQALEATYKIPSKLQMIFYNTTHNYKYGTFKYYLDDAFQTNTRELYQPELFGTFGVGADWRTENSITFPYHVPSRYFWVEAVQDTKNPGPVERVNFHAVATKWLVQAPTTANPTPPAPENTVKITFPVKPTHFTQIKIYLHSKMVDLTRPVDVFVNGTKVATRNPALSTTSLRSMDSSDPSYQYEDVMTVKIP